MLLGAQDSDVRFVVHSAPYLRPALARVARWMAILLIILLAAPAALASVLFVDSRMPASGDGTSWAQAKQNIGEALSAAVAGDEIWVASGTYVQSLNLKEGVALYGGFAGTEAQRDQRSPAAYPVQIVAVAGQLQAIRASAIANIRLDGLTVRGGSSAALVLQDVGTTAAIVNCVFRGSPAEGIRCYRSHPVIQDSFVHNNGDDGIYCYYASPTIERCAIVANAAPGIFCDNGSPTVSDTVIVGNNSNALRLNGTSIPTLTNGLIVGQAASALYVTSYSAPVVLNCTFASNVPGGAARGGALSTANSGTFTLRNTVFIDNTDVAVREGSYGNNEVSNCLFRSNPGGDYFDRERYATFTGAASIDANVAGAGATVDGDPLFAETATGTWTAAPVYDSSTCRTSFTDAAADFEPGALVGLVINCDTGQRLHGLITANTETTIEVAIYNAAVYVQAGDSYAVRDFLIREDSACVDAGSPIGAPAADLDGSPRPMDAPDRGVDGSETEYDIGVYEYQPDFGPKTLTLAGIEGGGTVTPSQGGSYTFGTPVSLQATPKRGCTFDRWLMRQHVDPPVVPLERTSSQNPYSLSMTQDWDVWAHFGGTALYILNLSTEGPGTVIVTPPNGPYAEDTVVTLEAIPTGTGQFLLWSGSVSGPTNPVTLTMNEDKTVAAVFGVAPTANFTGTPDQGLVPLTVQFTDTSEAGTSPIAAWAWDFESDGTIDSTDPNPSHVFDASGDYTVSLTVTTAVGSDTEVKSECIHVDEAPEAEFSATPTVGRAPFAVSFTDASSAGSAAISAWAWDFDNDGTTDSTLQNPSHLYSSPGIYSVRLTVTTSVGNDSRLKNHFVRVGVLPQAQPEGSFGGQYEDLVPLDTQVVKYDSARYAVITGLVRDGGGAPLASVAVTLLRHPEYGTAYTDATGRFALPVEGGGPMTAVYEKPGYIVSHRTLEVAWNDVSITDNVTLLAADTACTEMVLDGDPASVYSHRSTTVSDSGGTRACTFVLSGDTGVSEVDSNGNVLRSLTHFTARATEFRTEESMPAKLPPTSAYTYCVELAIDGADRVRFDKPVTVWIENFVGYAVGELVPVGYYDRAAGVWKPENDGVVVRLLDTDANGTVDALDATGDGAPDDLDGDTRFDDEVTGLTNTQLYAAGTTFWRSQVTHFTSFDHNNPYGPPGDGIPPTPHGGPTPGGDGRGPGGGTPGFGVVTHKGRAFHEDIPIPGTGLTLHYASDRTNGYQTVITVPVSDDTPLPPSLKEMRVVVEIGGRVLQQTLAPATNQTAQIGWDGFDWRGQPLPEARANVRVEFVYDALLWSAGGLNPAQQTRSFAKPGVSATLIPARTEWVFTQQFDSIELTSGKRPDMLATGWTLSNHHHLATRGRSALRRGDGEIVTHPSWIIDTVPGTGRPDDPYPVAFTNIQGVCLDAAGTLYAADMALSKVFAVDRAGVGSVIAGANSGYSGDGGPATAARLNSPRDVAVDAQGRVFIADTGNDRVRVIERNGVITTVAGGAGNGYAGDNGPAVNAKLNRPHGVAVDAHGNLFIADTNNHRVRRVDPSGVITTYAGTGSTTGGLGDEGPATQAVVRSPRDLAIDSAGNLFIAGAGVYRIRKIDLTGTITTVAGTGQAGTGGEGENGLATAAELQGAYSVAVDRGGNLYISEDSRIRRVDVGGIISTFAGTGQAGYTGDGNLARTAQLRGACYGFAVDTLSNLYISDNANRVVRRVSSGLSDFQSTPENGEYTFAEANGVAHVMDATGRHLRTVDQATGKTLLTYNYDANGALASLTDLRNETLTIQRNSQGVPTAIVSPDGVTTGLTVDASNHLTAVAYPDGGAYSMTYAADGLLEDISANGRTYNNTYDTFGRVNAVETPLPSTWTFAGGPGEAGSEAYAAQTPENDAVSYENRVLPSGALETTITDAAGLVTTYEQAAGESSEKITLPTGTTSSAMYGVDPLFHFKRMNSYTTRMPSGLQSGVAWDTQYADTNQDEIHDRLTFTTTLQPGTTAPRVWTVVNDTRAGTITSTSPENRVSAATYDPDTLLVASSQVPGLSDVVYEYDARGRLLQTTVGAREVTLSYDTAGNLATVTEPVTGTVAFDYDSLGRVTQITQPDQTTTVAFDYDLDGNLESITLPTQVTHGFGYDNLNRNTSYTTPLDRTYTYTYDDSNRLATVTLPSTAAIQYNYVLGRLASVVTPDGTTTVVYDTAGRVQTTSRGSEAVTLGYDGDLLASRTLSGTLNQTLALTYNDDFSVRSVTYAGATEEFAYDRDDLLTGAGDFTLTRNTQNGLPTSLTDGTATVTRSINGYGEVTGVSTAVNGTTVSWATTVDNAGRITAKTESVAGATTTYAYTYDALGHLSTVTKNGILDEAYVVDANGRRTDEDNVSRGISNRSFTYDDEDRLLTAGAASYTYDDDGFLATKTLGSATTTYEYTRTGGLKRVTLPDTTVLEYVLDASDQRLAKKVNGVVTEKYLWAGLTQLLAVYDGANTLVARFAYADGPLPVKMTQGGQAYYLAYDQVGSLRAILDAAGTVVHQIIYDSFGNILTETASGLTVPFGFAGGLHDRQTALVRFGFRDYDPDTGRWTAKDPLGFEAGDANLYAYCFSDPVGLNDPPGLGAYEDFLYHSGNFFSGWGDALSFGLTAELRELTGAGQVVDTHACLYLLGEATGVAHATALGGAWGSAQSARSGLSLGMRRANRAFPRGIEVVEGSHWIPSRFTRIPAWIRESSANIKPMWGSDHALADPHRYRLLRGWWKDQNQMPSRLIQQWNRMPGWVQGASAGSGFGATSTIKINLCSMF